MTLLRSAFHWGMCLLSLYAAAAHAQAPFPSDALKSATSLAAAYAALGVGGAEPSGYLLLDAPDVAAPGKVRSKLSSEIPGTVYLVLLRGSPANPAALPVAPPATQAARSAVQALPTAPQALTPALVIAEKFAPSNRAVLQAEFEVGATQWMTLLAFAQGRWFIAAREIKVGKLR